MAKMVLIPTQTQEEAELYLLLLNDLDKINRMSGQFRYTENFIQAWSDFRVYDRDNPPFYDDRFSGYVSRRPNHVMKLSMIMAASRRSEMVLTEDDIKDAIAALEKAELRMQSVFRGVGKSDISEIMNRMMAYLLASPTSEIPVWQIASTFSSDMDKFTMDRVFATLEAMKFARICNKPGADDYVKILTASYFNKTKEEEDD